MTKVTERAVFWRVSRKLALDFQQLKTCRDNSQWIRDLGRYYAVDERNNIVSTHIDLEGFGRGIGVLLPCEEMA